MQVPATLALLAPLALAACAFAQQPAAAPPVQPAPPAAEITKKDWGTVDGKPVHLWTLRNGRGM